MKKIALIEDDPSLNKNISEALSAEGMEVKSTFDGLLAERLLRNSVFDCIILDLNLPGKNGYEICQDFKKYNNATPILMLTAFDEIDDKIKGFEVGADDYLTKPFYMKELIARIHSLIKRTENQKIIPANKIISVDDIIVNTGSKKVTRQGKEVVLTPREYQILVRLIESKGEIIPKKELIKEIWGTSFDANTNTIEVYINFLRNKLDKPFGKDSIKTKIGFGYYFNE